MLLSQINTQGRPWLDFTAERYLQPHYGLEPSAQGAGANLKGYWAAVIINHHGRHASVCVCMCVCVAVRRAASADEVCDRFKHSTFTCRHSPVSEGYYCVASQPWLPAAHNNTRGARGRAGRLELGGRERLTDECEARRTEGVAQEQLCVCVTVWVCLEKEIRIGSKKRSRPSVTDLRPGRGSDRGGKDPFLHVRYRAAEAEPRGWQDREQHLWGLSGLFGRAGFHSDNNMGAVVGTLTMQTKQRRPSRGTLVQREGMKRWRGDKRATESRSKLRRNQKTL